MTAALFGYTNAIGCYPQWVSGGNYVAGVWVSDTESTETTTSCTTGTTGCVNGSKTVTTTKKYNFQCKSGAASGWCSQSGYQPTGIYGGSAWDKSAECDATAAAPTVTAPAAWSGGGCPAAYSAGSDYESGDSVSIYNAQLGYTSVYTCKEGQSYLWCSMSGYEPGTGSAWSQAWELKGSCTGTIAPTGSPIHVVLAAQGGCPGEYVVGTEYEEADKVSKDGVVYQCKGWPMSAHCAQAGYAPGVKVGENEYWKEAWTVLGTCSGTIAPTSSPNFASLANLGACPDEWQSKAIGDSYEEGDRVSVGGLVYQCKAWPFSGHCGQAGYQPQDGDSSTSGAWKDAWTVAGYCSGSMGPTSSPSFNALTTVGACPDEWSSSAEYEEGDMVSVSVSTTPIRKVAYKCKAWPYSGHCAQFSPAAYGGDLGWALAGSCDGSVGPTSSPSFDKLQDVGTGCPDAYSASTNNYEAGDKVTIQVSSSPVRAIVYECREWPNTGYCNQGSGFEPGTQYGGMAWKLLGSCDGSMSPTQSPARYSGTCTYNQCVTAESPTLTDSCVHGSSTDCTCTTTGSGTSQVTVCTKPRMVTTCSNVAVDQWSSSTDYVKNDVIRLGAQRYKCREWPNYLWCRSSAYVPEPGTDSGVWTNAWAKDGTCP